MVKNPEPGQAGEPTEVEQSLPVIDPLANPTQEKEKTEEEKIREAMEARVAPLKAFLEKVGDQIADAENAEEAKRKSVQKKLLEEPFVEAVKNLGEIKPEELDGPAGVALAIVKKRIEYLKGRSHGTGSQWGVSDYVKNTIGVANEKADGGFVVVGKEERDAFEEYLKSLLNITDTKKPEKREAIEKLQKELEALEKNIVAIEAAKNAPPAATPTQEAGTVAQAEIDNEPIDAMPGAGTEKFVFSADTFGTGNAGESDAGKQPEKKPEKGEVSDFSAFDARLEEIQKNESSRVFILASNMGTILRSLDRKGVVSFREASELKDLGDKISAEKDRNFFRELSGLAPRKISLAIIESLRNAKDVIIEGGRAQKEKGGGKTEKPEEPEKAEPKKPEKPKTPQELLFELMQKRLKDTAEKEKARKKAEEELQAVQLTPENKVSVLRLLESDLNEGLQIFTERWLSEPANLQAVKGKNKNFDQLNPSEKANSVLEHLGAEGWEKAKESQLYGKTATAIERNNVLGRFLAQDKMPPETVPLLLKYCHDSIKGEEKKLAELKKQAETNPALSRQVEEKEKQIAEIFSAMKEMAENISGRNLEQESKKLADDVLKAQFSGDRDSATSRAADTVETARIEKALEEEAKWFESLSIKEKQKVAYVMDYKPFINSRQFLLAVREKQKKDPEGFGNLLLAGYKPYMQHVQRGAWVKKWSWLGVLPWNVLPKRGGEKALSVKNSEVVSDEDLEKIKENADKEKKTRRENGKNEAQKKWDALFLQKQQIELRKLIDAIASDKSLAENGVKAKFEEAKNKIVS